VGTRAQIISSAAHSGRNRKCLAPGTPLNREWFDVISSDVALLCFKSLQVVASVAHCPRDHFVCARVNDKAALSLSDPRRVFRSGWYKVVTSEISLT
jgi:hypothetical protein